MPGLPAAEMAVARRLGWAGDCDCSVESFFIWILDERDYNGLTKGINKNRMNGEKPVQVQGMTVSFGANIPEIQRERVVLFLGDLVEVCRKHGFDITATEHEGMLISNDEVEGYIWSIFSIQNNDLPSITEQPCRCPNCHWEGTVWDGGMMMKEGRKVYLATILVSGQPEKEWVIVAAANIAEASRKVENLLQDDFNAFCSATEMEGGAGIGARAKPLYAHRTVVRIETFPIWKIIGFEDNND